MHVLGRLTLYLLRSSVGMFVPKVFSTINSALADPQATPALRRMAYQVCFQFLNSCIQRQAVNKQIVCCL
jgi:hypothetical protein